MKVIKEIRHKGAALIYVILLIIPLMFVIVWISDMVVTDFKVSSGIINYQQASYNAETGIALGIKKLQEMNYDELYNGYNTSRYFILDGSDNQADSKNYCETTITNPLPGIFNIKSRGNYDGIKKSEEMTINRETLLNLNRKITAEKITLSSGKVNFRLPSAGSGLLNFDKILVLRKDGLNVNDNIYGFNTGQSLESGVKTTGTSLFYKNSLKGSAITDILDAASPRDKWNSSPSGVQYFISQPGEDITINLLNINNMVDDFYTGFRNFSGEVDGSGNMQFNNVRIIFADGNISLEDIMGDYAEGSITNAERYFNNLVIYCTGKITVKDCEFMGYNGNAAADGDINFSMVAKEIEFLSETGNGSTINYRGANQGLLDVYKPFIVDIIKNKTSIDSNWGM